MKVAIVTSYNSNKPAGLERVLLEQLRAFSKISGFDGVEYIVYVSRASDLDKTLEKEKIKLRVIKIGWGRLWREIGLFFAPKADAYLFNGPLVPLFFIPKNYFVLVYDFAYKYFGSGSWSEKLKNFFTDRVSAIAFRRAKKIIAISNATGDEVRKFFGINKRKIITIYLGWTAINELKSEPVPGLPEKYFMFIGTLKERKNVLSVIQAYAEFRKDSRRDNIKLVIVGKRSENSPYVNKINSFIREYQLEDGVFFTGHTTDNQVSYIYSHAIALVFPSLLEGFGMPILEAMSFGVPVITSNVSSLGEVAGEAALLVNPKDINQIALDMDKIVTVSTLKGELTSRGYERIRLFSWDKAAKEYTRLFRESYLLVSHSSFKKVLFVFLKESLLKMVLILFSLIFVSVLLELVLRFIPESPRQAVAEIDSRIGTIYKKDLDLSIDTEDFKDKVRFKTNSQGFIGDDWPLEKLGVRVANFGDSFTAGGSVDYQDNYVTKFGERLDQLVGKSVESLNLGIVGQGTLDSFNTYLYYGSKTDPDFVVLWFYLGNDFGDNYQDYNQNSSEDGTVAINSPPTEQSANQFKDLIKRTKLFQLVMKAASKSASLRSFLLSLPKVKNIFYSFALADLPGDLEMAFWDNEKAELAAVATERYLKEFYGQVKMDKRKFFVFLLPAHFQVDKKAQEKLLEQYPKLKELKFDPYRANRTLTEILDKNAIPYFDLTSAFIDSCADNCRLYYCSFCHLSVAGNQLVADKAGEVFFKSFKL